MPGPRWGEVSRVVLVLTAATVVTACGRLVLHRAEPTGAVHGALQVVGDRDRPDLLGSVVVRLDPLDSEMPIVHGGRARRVASETDVFEPALAAFGPADSVVFVNHGALAHRVFSAELGETSARAVGPTSASAPVGLSGDGPVQFFCSLHPNETFTLYISGSPYYTVTGPDGSYTIPRVPDGRYRLSIWSERVAGRVRDIEIRRGRPEHAPIYIDPELVAR